MRETKYAKSTMALAFALVCAGCGDLSLPSADLPRFTSAGVSITATEQVETLPIAGCHSVWQSRNEQPPEGACEETVLVRRFVAKLGGATAEAVVSGDPASDPMYGMQLVASGQNDELGLFVVLPHEDATVVDLVDGSGAVVDSVRASGGIVAVAALGRDLTVEARSSNGALLAECPPDGVTIDNVTYVCSLAPGASVPVTTTTLSGAP